MFTTVVEDVDASMCLLLTHQGLSLCVMHCLTPNRCHMLKCAAYKSQHTCLASRLVTWVLFLGMLQFREYTIVHFKN